MLTETGNRAYLAVALAKEMRAVPKQDAIDTCRVVMLIYAHYVYFYASEGEPLTGRRYSSKDIPGTIR